MPFAKGQSGNPGGRMKLADEVRDYARGLSMEALELHAKIMRDEGAPLNVRQSSGNVILDRAWGKPAQAVTGEDGEGPVQVAMILSDIDRAKALAALVAKAKAVASPEG